MKEKILAMGVLVSVLFLFGCTMPNFGGKTQKPSQYNISVTPRTIVPGGVSTIRFTVNDKYERSLRDVTVSVSDVPGGYSVSPTTSNLGDIPAGQARPQVITITAPSDVHLTQVITPKISVCYNYKTDFYGDMIFNSYENPPTTVPPHHSGCTNGPVSVSISNFEGYPSSENPNVVSGISINNIGNGRIMKVNSINVSMTTPTGQSYSITGMNVTFFDCTNSGTTSNGAVSVSINNDKCDKFNSPVILSGGLQGSLMIETYGNVSKDKQYDIQTLSGTVDFDYCYDVPVGSITVRPVGVQ